MGVFLAPELPHPHPNPPLEGEGVLQREIDANQVKLSSYRLLAPYLDGRGAHGIAVYGFAASAASLSSACFATGLVGYLATISW